MPQLAAAQVESTVCPSCRGLGAEAICSIDATPVMVTTAFETAAEARATARGDIDLAACKGCGFVFNRVFDQKLATTGAYYESTQSASPHFSAFARDLATTWVERYGLKGSRVIEVGCGQGHFMTELVNAGAGSVLGIDPLADEKHIPEAYRSKIDLDATELASSHIAAEADALFCRHSIEHVGRVADFLELVAAWAAAHPGAPVLFEAPASERIFKEGAFWDVFYEHCCYFTEATLATAFRTADMDVLRTDLVYGGQYLLLDAKAGSDQNATAAVEADNVRSELETVADFGAKMRKSIAHTRERLNAFAAAGDPAVIWQGAAKTVSLLAAIGDDIEIDCAVDLNTSRHNLFLPPRGLEIVSPESLRDRKPAHVVLMNEVYLKEVRKILDDLGLASTKLYGINHICGDGEFYRA